MPLEFTVLQSDLARELSLAQGSVEKKSIHPLLRHVLLVAKDGKAGVAATDYALTYQGAMPAKVAEEGSVAVLAEKLQAWCRDFPGDAEIKIKVQKNGWVRVQCGREHGTIGAVPGADFPGFQSFSEPTATIPSDVLLESLQMERISVGSDPVKVYTNGALIEIHPETGIRMVATNVHTMAVTDRAFDMEVSPEDTVKFLLPDKAMAELARLIPLVGGEERYQVRVYVSNNHVFFGLRNSLFGARLIETRYPDYARVFPADVAQRILIPAGSLRHTLSRVGLFANESHAVDLTFSGDGLCVIATSSESGDGGGIVDVEYTGQPVTMRVNALYLQKFLQKAGNEPIEILFGDPRTQQMIEWRIVDDPTFRFVVALMSLPKEQTANSTT